ncbi:MAG: tRNA uridine-5-carboxymethylaminomethyl(34) synthesis GTPase MnmE [Halioglobus sp.]
MTTLTSLDGDTIVAIATPPGRGGVGIIRISGDKSHSIATNLTGLAPDPRTAHFTHFRGESESKLDSGITLFFPGPASFTGEDVVELQAHGGPVILDLLVRECCRLGARVAKPGEFSERAFLNDKIDLAQAEAIADLINSTTSNAALNASRSLQGAFSNKIEGLVKSVTELRVYVEAAIDFPEEEIDFIGDGVVKAKLEQIIHELAGVKKQAKQGSLIRDGMKLVIAGKPNAGKSSLLNALSGQDSAIVTPIEGTTRDVLHEHIQIDGMPLHVVDTAGLRDSVDIIEQEGVRRAREEIKSADRIVILVDSSEDIPTDTDLYKLLNNNEENGLEKIPVTVIHNKCDLNNAAPGIDLSGKYPVLRLSAKFGDGIEFLKEHLKTVMGYKQEQDGQFSARRRHLQSLDSASVFLNTGLDQLLSTGAGELLAEDLKQCQNALGEITGAVTSDELLGEIFSNFCIGK